MAKMHVLHQNAARAAPLFDALERAALSYRDWPLAEGALDLTEAPPEGVFYERMSACSHTRGHRFAPALSAALLGAAARFAGPRSITKHHRAGKDPRVRLLDDVAAFAGYLESDACEPTVAGVTSLQQQVEAPGPFITRGAWFYAVRAASSAGVELCPAHVCQTPATREPAPRFQSAAAGRSALPPRRCGRRRGVGVHGRPRGIAYTYDVNTDTNHHPEAAARTGIFGMTALAARLGRELIALRLHAGAASAAAD